MGQDQTGANSQELNTLKQCYGGSLLTSVSHLWGEGDDESELTLMTSAYLGYLPLLPIIHWLMTLASPDLKDALGMGVKCNPKCVWEEESRNVCEHLSDDCLWVSWNKSTHSISFCNFHDFPSEEEKEKEHSASATKTYHHLHLHWNTGTTSFQRFGTEISA